MFSGYENCKTIILYGIGTIFKQTNVDYLIKFPDVEILTIETRNSYPLTISGHVTVQITPRNFLVTALIRAIHHYEWTYHLMALFTTKTTKAQVTIALLKQQCNYAIKILLSSQNHDTQCIGDLPVAFRLCFKASPSAKPFIVLQWPLQRIVQNSKI